MYGGLFTEDQSTMPVRAISKNASGLIIDPFAQEYLLHFRDHKTQYYPETWALFGGGSEGRESPKQTLIRELNEELTITVQPAALIARGKRAKSGGEYSHYFHVVVDRSKHSFQLMEGADMAWFSAVNMLELLETKQVTPGLQWLHDRNRLMLSDSQLREYQSLVTHVS